MSVWLATAALIAACSSSESGSSGSSAGSAGVVGAGATGGCTTGGLGGQAAGGASDPGGTSQGGNAAVGGTSSAGSSAGGNSPAGGAGGAGGTGGSTAGTGGAAGAAGAGGGSVGLESQQVLNSVRRVNDYWILNHIGNAGTNHWDRATYFSANMMAYSQMGIEDYRTYTEGWAASHAWGLNGGDTTRFADNHTAGQAYIALYRLDPKSEKLASITNSISAMVASSQRDDWYWIDALHMAMPVFAALGQINGEPQAYSDAMYELFVDTRDRRGLFNETDGLWYRDSGYKPPATTEPGGADIYWSRGNGWVMAAMAKTLTELPASDAHRSEYVSVLRSMASALVEVQRPDGFYNSSLHDPLDHGGPESSGTGFFTYAMAWGVNNGLLDRATYEPAIVAGWNALANTAVHPDGRLGYCQRIGAAPADTSYDETTDYCVGAFIMAGLEVAKLVPRSVAEEIVLPATLDSTTAEQTGNEALNATDGSILTRWSAEYGPQTTPPSTSQSIVLDLGSDVRVDAIEVLALQNRAYQYTVEGATQAGSYRQLANRSSNAVGGTMRDTIGESVRYVRLTFTGAADYTGAWISISEIRLIQATN
ncbi:MAG: glycoside hydrolase family 88 protein [Myxococcales bacterium]|nr:glycoside hydrolase family 88 protein [Myxococcales bacterium]